MSEKKRFLKSINVNFISLVDKAANQKTIIFKSADISKNTYQRTVKINKVDDDQHEVIGIVYEPDVADSDGDYTTAEVIKQAEYQFMKNRNTNNVDQQHDYSADEGFVAESWIVQKNDSRLPDAKEGSWAVVIKVENTETWAKVKSGEITGLSMAGLAVVEEVEKSDKSLLEKISKILKDGLANIKKDFNSQWNQDQLRRMSWALTDSISEIINDDTVTDKKTEIIKNVDQFKAAVEAYNFNETTPVTKIKKEEPEMTKEEIANLVKSTVAETIKSVIDEAIGSVNENITKMKTEVNEKAGAIEKRLDVVEKATPGSVQIDGVDDVAKANKDYKGIGWLS